MICSLCDKESVLGVVRSNKFICRDCQTNPPDYLITTRFRVVLSSGDPVMLSGRFITKDGKWSVHNIPDNWPEEISVSTELPGFATEIEAWNDFRSVILGRLDMLIKRRSEINRRIEKVNKLLNTIPT